MNLAYGAYPALDLFSELLDAPSPSGREEGVARIVGSKLSESGYDHETDGAGNVLVRLPGRDPSAPKCCLAAHMDEIGMVITGIEPDGALAVSRSGGLFPWKIGECPVQIVGDDEPIVGVLSMGSGHSPHAHIPVQGWDQLRILTGLSAEQVRAAGVRPGSSAVPIRQVRGPVLFGDPSDPVVGAWTFDDRMGVVALLRLLGRMKEQDLTPYAPMIIAFTVHEEGGAHGAKVLAHREKPEVFVAVDGCPTLPEAQLALDGRPAIWSMDQIGHYDQRLIGAFRAAARRAGTDLQVAAYQATASDASLVYSSGSAPRIACLGHVRENSHGYEVARVSVFDHLLATLASFVAGWDGE